jgi:predicted ATP-grasp superfamily ATP-dependent carboligase
VLRQVRDPFVVMAALRREGLPSPDVYREAPRATPSLIVKPFRSGGGHRVRRWRRGTRVPAAAYLQDFIEGIPGSIVFAAADGRAVPLGVSRQLVGDARFGANGFRYCGSILHLDDDGRSGFGAAVRARAAELAVFAARTFRLVGVNGIDFIVREGVPVLIEVNPRWTASMELVERATGMAMFSAHAAACEGDLRPAEALARAVPRARVVGKAVVFARTNVAAPDTNAWLANPDVHDVPHSAEPIRAGRPICTVFAEGADRETCYAALAARAGAVYASLSRTQASTGRAAAASG